MAAIGNSPTQQAFTPAIDYFSGNGSTTAFTLSRPVASVAQVQVTIDNVAQNPSSAYTVSGSTITFTSAPLSGTNNIYVYYTSPITQVIAPGQGTVNATSMASSTGTGAGVFQTSPTITTPTIDTITSAASTALTLKSAGTTAVTVDTSQNVLVGTTTSTNNIRLNQKLAVITAGSGNFGGVSNTGYNGTSAGTGPIYDMQRSRGTTDGSMTAVASGDTLGYVVFRGSDGAGFVDSSYITGQVDGAVGSGSVPGRLVFNTSSAERMRIDSSGNLLVGTTSGIGSSTGARLAVDATASGLEGAVIKNSGGASYSNLLLWNTATSGNNYFAYFCTEGGAYPGINRGSIQYNRAGGVVVYNTTSDYRAKTVTGPVQNALSKLALLKPSTGRMNGATQDIDFFVSHELQEVVPSAVSGEKDDVNEDNTPKYQMVDKSAVIPLLTAAIQELKAINDTQAETINALTARIEALEGK